MPAHHKSSTPTEKLAWLLKNGKLWENIPGLDTVIDDPALQQKLEQLVDAARSAKLYCKGTDRGDIRISLRKYIVQARALRRKFSAE